MNNNTHVILFLSLQEKSCTKTNKRKAGGCGTSSPVFRVSLITKRCSGDEDEGCDQLVDLTIVSLLKGYL